MMKRTGNKAAARATEALEAERIDVVSRSLNALYRGWATLPGVQEALQAFLTGAIDQGQFLSTVSTQIAATKPTLVRRLDDTQTKGFRLGATINGVEIDVPANNWARWFSEQRTIGVGQRAVMSLQQYIERSMIEGIPLSSLKRNLAQVMTLDERGVNSAIGHLKNVNDNTAPRNRGKVHASYMERAARVRRKMIARTEVMATINHGKFNAFVSARQAGLVDDSVMMKWITVPGECPRCAALSGIRIPIGEQFSMVEEAPAFPPLHPNCRCTIVLD